MAARLSSRTGADGSAARFQSDGGDGGSAGYIEGARREAGPGGNGRIEIVVSRGRRVIVDAGIDPDALSRILDVLERR